MQKQNVSPGRALALCGLIGATLVVAGHGLWTARRGQPPTPAIPEGAPESRPGERICRR